ncbi:MAG: hypothetical protein MJY95_08420 [Bacteroidaceae bacterium]|nr:hypothetical protein [Bacteroidaceae bacterium]
MSEAGRVLTGFSKPYIASYSASGTTVTYSNADKLARGVDVNIEPDEAGDANNFYADNQIAESEGGVFTGGTVTLNVDGLHTAMLKRILGLPTADTAGWTAFGDEMSPPYLGLGFIARYQSGGTVKWVPKVLPKVKFNIPSDSAATQDGDEIEWQTQELTAAVLRDDTEDHNWKYLGSEYATEALAETALVTKLGGTTQ